MRAPGRPAAELDRRAAAGAASAVPDQSVQSSSSAVAPASSCARVRAHQVADGAGPAATSAPVSPSRVRDVEHGPPDQLARVAAGSRSSACAALLLALPQLPGQAAYVAGVEPAERPGQQRLGPGGVDVVDVVGVVVVEVEHHPQRVDQRQRGRVADQRHLVAGHLDRHPGGAEGAAQRRDATGGRTAPAPPSRPTAMPSSRWARRSRSARCSASARSLSKVRTTTRPSPCSPGDGRRREERLARALGDAAGQPDPAGDPLGGGEDAAARTGGWSPSATTSAGRAVGARERRSGSRGCRAPRRRGRRRSTGAGRPPRPGRGRRRRSPAAARPGRSRCPGTRRRRRARSSARSSSRCTVASIVARRIRSE